MDQDAQITRVVAAYQFVAQTRGESVPVASLRLFLVGEHPMGPEVLNPLLRRLDGQVVDFFDRDGYDPGQGILRLHEAPRETTWDEIDGGVEIDGLDFTHLTITPV